MSGPVSVCPECGAPLRSGASEGMCVACLLGAGAALVMDGPEAASQPEFPIAFGHYDLHGELGRGGAGRVFSAKHRTLDRSVAIKLLAGGELASPDFVQRFRNEARAAASLDHSHIVPVFEVGQNDGQLFLAMRLVEGGSLAKKLSENRAAFSEGAKAAQLIATMARAAHHAHQHGVLHRDIKPGNILLDATGTPHLTDFGLARLTEQDSTLTRTNVMLGTPSYMAPEQARGGIPVTTAVDVYGLGAVLYELLTGQPPFAGGTTFETVRQLIETEVRRPSSLVPGLNRDLETICLKCLAKDPASRYGSAEAVADDLERWLRHEPIQARAVSTVERVAKWVRRHRALAAALLAAALILTTAVVMLITANSRLQHAQDRLDLQTRAQRRDLVRLNMETGNRLAAEGDGMAALASFAEAAAMEKDAARLAEHRFRFEATLGRLPVLEHTLEHTDVVRTAAFSPDGTHVVTACADNFARIWNPATDEKMLLPHQSPVWWAGYAPGGIHVVTRTLKGEVQVWDALTGVPVAGPFSGRATMNIRDGLTAAVAISGDGSALTILKEDTVELRRVRDGARIAPLLMCKDMPGAAIFSAGDTKVTVLCEDGAVLTFDALSGAVLAENRGLKGGGWRAGAWTGDGRRLAATDRNFCVQIMDAELQNSPLIRLPHSAMALGCAWNRESTRLLTWSYDNAVRVWDPAAAVRPVSTMRHRGPALGAAMSPDEKWIASASADSTARLWDAASGEPVGALLHHGGAVRHLAWSRDGARLLTSSTDGMVRVWGVDRAMRARQEWKVPTAVQQVALSPDGKSAAIISRDREVTACSADGGITRNFVHPEGPFLPSHCVWSADHKLKVVFSDGLLCEWDTGTGALLHSVRCGLDPASGEKAAAYMLAPDAHCIAVRRDSSSALLLDPATGEVVQTLDNEPGFPVWSPCGRFTAGRRDGNILVRDAGTGNVVYQIPCPPRTEGIFLSDGARLMALSMSDFRIFIIDPATGATVAGPLAHDSVIRQVVFSKDGSLLASAGADFTLRLWSTATGVPLAPPVKHTSYVMGIAMHPSGRAFLTGENNGTVHLWEVPALDFSVEKMRDIARRLNGAKQ